MRTGDRPSRTLAALLPAVAALALFSDAAAASNVAAGLQEAQDVDVPTWLYLLTGGAAIGASGLLVTLATDRVFVDALHDWSLTLPTRASARRALTWAGRLLGLAALALVVAVGLTGPEIPVANAAILLVFVGLRAGLTMVAYLVGNPWPALNPWRTVAAALPNGFREYPPRLGAWPAVVGLLALVWIEVVVPVNTAPAALALAVALYSVVTVAGAVAFSPEDWFRNADPLSVAFRFYGAVAPVRRTDGGVALALPGAGLRGTDAVDGLDDVAFALALVWELTYSGFVATPPGAATVEFLVGRGVPAALAYLGTLLVGYALFVGVYWLAARRVRRTATTYLSAPALAVRFAAPLLAIAAGYHLAHYLSFFVSLSPSFVAVLGSPLAPPGDLQQLVIPPWFVHLDAGFVLAGHLLAIWVAHVTAFDLFPSRVQAIHSQYPFVTVMVAYTMVSLWLLTLPTVMPPYVEGAV